MRDFDSNQNDLICPGCEDEENAPHLPPCELAWTRPTRTWTCSCGTTVERYRGQDDVTCDRCGQWFNAFGQALRNDWMGNPAMHDDDIDDMEGFERQQLAREYA